MGIKNKLSTFTAKFVLKDNFNKGFTFIEMLIIVPIAILTIGIFVAAIVNMTGEVLAVRGTNSLTYNIQTALNKIEQDVSLSGAYLATNSIDLSTSPYQGYDNGSTYNASTTNFHNADATNGAMLILNSYTTASNPLDTTRNIVYTSAQPNACNSGLVNQNPPVMINIIYFIKNNTLWRRVIVPSYYETVGCIGAAVGIPWQQPSCAVDVSGTLCKTQDVRLVDNVKASDFTVNYYTGSDATTANAIASDSAQTDSARSAALQTTNTVGVSITAKTTIAGREISQSGSIRAVSPNNNRTLTVSTTSPGAPTGLTAVGGMNQVVLNWVAPASDGGSSITGYKIYRGNTSGSEVLIANLGNVLTYTDTGLLPQNTYYYQVKATNTIGNSLYSNESTTSTTGYNYSFISGTIVPTTYKTNSMYIYNTTTYTPRSTPGTGVYALVVVPTGTVRFMIQSAGGGGPYDDGDQATPPDSGAMVYFETSQLAGKTLEFNYGYKTSGYGSGQWTPLAHPNRPLDNPNIARGAASTQATYGGVGSTDCLIYNITDNYLVAHVEGGTGSVNYDSGPSRVPYAYLVSSTTLTTTASYVANGNSNLVRSNSANPGASPWQNNLNSVRDNFTSPASTVNTLAGKGGYVANYGSAIPQSALIIMEKM